MFAFVVAVAVVATGSCIRREFDRRSGLLYSGKKNHTSLNGQWMGRESLSGAVGRVRFDKKIISIALRRSTALFRMRRRCA